MNRLVSFQVCLAAAVVFLISPGLASAQSQFGSIAGHVTDQTDALVSGATVRTTNEATNVSFSTTTGSSGSYVIGGLLPGNYTVTAQAAGFKEFHLTGVQVIAAQTTGTDLHLQVGAAVEQITVSATSAPLNTESGSVSTSAPKQTIEMPANLPQLTQSYAETLAPYLQGQEYVGGRQVAAYGSRSYDRRINIDGVTYGLQNASTLREPPGSVDELEVTSITADAEHQTSNTVQMTTTKGTNLFHGFIWDQIQNSVFNSRVWYVDPKAPHPPGTPSNTYGFSAGGPVYIPKLYNGRNKTFWHMTFEKSTLSQPGVSSDSIPSPGMFNGDFSQLLAAPFNIQLKNPYNGANFPNNQINATTCTAPCNVSAIGQNVMNLFNPAKVTDLHYVTSDFTSNNAYAPGLYMQPFKATFIRGDQQLGTKDNMHGLFGYSHQLITEVNSGIPSAGLDYVDYEYKYLAIAENHIFSPTVLNEVTFGWKAGNRSTITNTADGAALATSIGLPQPAVPPPPAGKTGGPIVNAGILGFNPQPLGAGVTMPYTVTFRDTVSWIHGRFTTKAGFELLRQTSNAQSFANLFGTYNFSGQFTGYPLGDLLLGLPSTTSRTQYPGPIGAKQYDYGYYVNVDARLTSKLTLNLGVRITDNTPKVEPGGSYYNFNRANGKLVLPSEASFSKLNPGLSPAILANIETAAQAGFPSELLNAQHLIAPRIGFAYQIFNDTVVRGGFGTFSSLLNNGGFTGGPFTAGIQNATNVLTCTSGAPPCTPAFDIANPFPGTGVQAVTGLGVSGLNPWMRVPQMYQWNFTIEHRLRGDFVLRTSYTGNHSSQLPDKGNINLPFASTTPFSASSLRYPQWNSVTYTDSGGNSSYNSLDVAVTRRWSHGVTLDGGYQLEKCTTNSDEGGLESNYGSFGALGITNENPYDRNRDKGNCESIPRHKFRMMYTANLPVGRGRAFLANPSGHAGAALNAVIGGWTYSGFFIATTGHYFTPYWNGGATGPNTSQTLLRPDRICSGKPATQTWDHIFEPSCFVAPPNGRYGNAGMGIIEGLGYWRYDNGVYKDFSFSKDERMPKLRLTMNAMNIFNHPTKSISSAAPFYINSPSTVNRANDIVYDSGLTANLGASRIFYLEGRIFW